MLFIAAQSLEYVLVPTKAVVSGSVVSPTADAISMAFVAEGATPGVSDWHAGSWETDTTQTPNVYYARCLVGPAQVVLTAGATYDVWVRVTDNPETPARRVGDLQAY